MSGTTDELRDAVRRRFAESAQVLDGKESCGCGSGSCCEAVADGMHGATVKAVKTSAPERRGLPVVEAAESAGCC